MPYNDPHTAAPNLWAWRQEEKWDYECSAAIFTKSKAARKALECFLLWKYRLEKGESTLCNHGRFHKNYVKSSNRSGNKRGVRLSERELNPSWGPSHPPLKLQGQPLDENWMGIRWSKPLLLSLNASSQVPNTSAVYKIFPTGKKLLTYIGESQRLHNRFIQHSRKFADIFFFIETYKVDIP